MKKRVAKARKIFSVVFCLVVGTCLTLMMIAENSENFKISTAIVVETLRFLGEDEVANDFLNYIDSNRVQIVDLGGKGVRAETGSNYFGDNVLSLDSSFLTLSRMETLWKKKKFATQGIDYLSWAETILHERVHMNQQNPQNVPLFEDPAYLEIARAHIRWLNRLEKIFFMVKDSADSSGEKIEKLSALKNILIQLKALKANFDEAVQNKINDLSLNTNLNFANRDLIVRADALLKEIAEQVKTLQSSASNLPAEEATDSLSDDRSSSAQLFWVLADKVIAGESRKSSESYQYLYSLKENSAQADVRWNDGPSSKCWGIIHFSAGWSAFPKKVLPGEKIVIDIALKNSASQNCGYRSVGQWVSVKFNGRLINELKNNGWTNENFNRTVKQKIEIETPFAQKEDEEFFIVLTHSCNGGGGTVRYVYRLKKV